MNKSEISTLAQRAQLGDRSAFETLYSEFFDKVYFFAKRNVGSEDSAREIASETFASALEHIGELRSGESFVGWLYSIAYSKCTAHIRDEARTEHFSSDEDMEQALADAALNKPLMLPEDYAVSRDTKEKLKAVIDSLPSELRSAVILYYYDDMSVAEVAKTLGTNENNAKQKLHKARTVIRKKIEKLFGSGAMFAAVPMSALLHNTADASYACAAASGAAKVAGTSLAMKFIGIGAAVTVAVGVPIGLSRLNNKNNMGDYRPENLSSESITEKAEQPVVCVTENEHFKMTFELHEIKDDVLYYDVSLEGVDDIGKDYIKNSQEVRDYIFYTETLNPLKMTESEYEAAADAYQQAHKDEPYEELFPVMYYVDEKGEWHYCTGDGSAGDGYVLSETVCTISCKVDCPADADSLTLQTFKLESVDSWLAHRYDDMDITLDLTGVARK